MNMYIGFGLASANPETLKHMIRSFHLLLEIMNTK